jgi:YfiH family protein
MIRNGFILREFQGITYYSCEAFESIHELRHGFSTRIGGGSDLDLNASSNHPRFLEALHFSGGRLVSLQQTHSDRVHFAEDISQEGPRIEGDALVTKLENAALAIKTADCIPILIADPVKKVVAAVHSGWRGTQKRIAVKTIEAMRQAYSCNPEDMLIAIGPGIRQCCFEVGSEVVDLFKKEFPEGNFAKSSALKPEKFYLDLVKILEIQLLSSGILPAHCFDSNLCTCCNTREFFSYRAEGAATGRMMSIIGYAK